MSNITSATTAIGAEIKQARQGMAFYEARIAELERLVVALTAIDGGSQGIDAAVSGKRKGNGRDGKATVAATRTNGIASPSSKRKRADVRVSNGASRLPSTSASFWKGLLSEAPMSKPDIMNAAVAALGVELDHNDTEKLKQRLASAITGMITTGAIRSEGKRRERRFYVTTT